MPLVALPYTCIHLFCVTPIREEMLPHLSFYEDALRKLLRPYDLSIYLIEGSFALTSDSTTKLKQQVF